MATRLGNGSGRPPDFGAARRPHPGDAARERAAQLRLTVLRFYYWATPLFFLADAAWGVSVRAAFLPRSDLRIVYYCFCLACAVLCHRRPEMTPFIGISESAVNLLLLALGVMLPIWGASDALLSGGDIPAFMTPAKLFNVMLSGSVLVLAFHRSQNRLSEQIGRTGRWV